MNKYIVQIGDEYLTDYKVKAGGEWVLTLSKDHKRATYIDEDDFVLTLCQKQCDEVQFIASEENQPEMAELPAIDPYDWL